MKYFFFLIMTAMISLSCNNKQSTPKDVVQVSTKAPIETTNEEVIEGRKTILCFGNSLTAAYGIDEADGWVALLQRRIDSLGMDIKVINAGLSGETTSGGLSRIDWVLNQKVDYFILELGANDMLRGLGVEATKENLEKILMKVVANNSDTKIIIAGMLSPPNMGPDYESNFNAIFPELSKKYNAELIPFFLQSVAGEKELNLGDGIHPNEKGQKIVFETVWATVKPVISLPG